MSANYEEKNIRQKLYDILSLEEDLRGQVVLKDTYDALSNWQFSIDELERLISNISIQSRIDTYLDCANEGSGSPILRAYARRRAEQLKEQLKETK